MDSYFNYIDKPDVSFTNTVDMKFMSSTWNIHFVFISVNSESLPEKKLHGLNLCNSSTDVNFGNLLLKQ